MKSQVKNFEDYEIILNYFNSFSNNFLFEDNFSKINKIIKSLIVILLVTAVIFLAWFMLGNSPTIEQVAAVLVIPVYVFAFGLYEQMNSKIERNQKFIFQTRELFQSELGKIKQALIRIEEKIK